MGAKKTLRVFSTAEYIKNSKRKSHLYVNIDDLRTRLNWFRQEIYAATRKRKDKLIHRNFLLDQLKGLIKEVENAE